MKNAMGHLAYIIEGVKRLPIGEKYPARVEVGDQVFEEEFLFCSISNTTSIGGFSLDKSVEATLDDGEFEVLLIKAPTSVAEANTIVSKLLARDFNNELIHLLHADSVTVHFPHAHKVERWTASTAVSTPMYPYRCLPTRCTWSFEGGPPSLSKGLSYKKTSWPGGGHFVRTYRLCRGAVWLEKFTKTS